IKRAKLAAEEAARAKSDFLAMMSHEIRTPITSVLGMADLLQQTPLTKEQAGFLGTLGTSTKTLLTILNDVLDISKLEAGKVTIETTPFPLRTTVADVLGFARATATAQSLVIDLTVAAEVPERVVGDPTRLNQILFNLLNNAIKFTERGFVHLRMSVAGRDGGTVTVLIEIEDSGIGIEPARLNVLFKAFSQADQSTTRRFGGTGLGLAITRKLIDLMGGDIGVDSEPGKGSRFWFTLPFAVADGLGGSADAADAAPQTKAPPRPLRLLLAEDNPVNRMLVRSMLEKFGHSVDTACNGREAVEKLAAGDYDAALMDMQMPEMDGEEATRLIRAMPPPKNRMPVIALTADVMAEHRQRYFGAGVDDLVAKPIDWDILAAALDRHAGNGGGR
ncbi:MAG: ATP-binding protein, partial [Rhodospirillaceae bacterium]